MLIVVFLEVHMCRAMGGATPIIDIEKHIFACNFSQFSQGTSALACLAPTLFAFARLCLHSLGHHETMGKSAVRSEICLNSMSQITALAVAAFTEL